MQPSEAVAVAGAARGAMHPAAVTAVGVLGRFHVLPGDQGQQAHRVRRPLAQFLFRQVSEQVDRVGDQRIDQRGARLPVVPGDLRVARVSVFARVGVVVRMIWVTVSRVATASSGTAEAKAHRCLSLSTPVASTTSLTLGKIRIGSVEWRSRRLKCVRSDGSNAMSYRTSPQAAFRRRSHRSSWTASKSDRPCRLYRLYRLYSTPSRQGPAAATGTAVERGIHVGEHRRREQGLPVLGRKRETRSLPGSTPGTSPARGCASTRRPFSASKDSRVEPACGT